MNNEHSEYFLHSVDYIVGDECDRRRPIWDYTVTDALVSLNLLRVPLYKIYKA